MLDPVLRGGAEVQDYDLGSWDPASAERLAADIAGWLAPFPLGSAPAAYEPATGAESSRPEGVRDPNPQLTSRAAGHLFAFEFEKGT